MRKRTPATKKITRKIRKPLLQTKKKVVDRKSKKIRTAKKLITKTAEFSFSKWLKNAFGFVKLAKLVHEFFI